MGEWVLCWLLRGVKIKLVYDMGCEFWVFEKFQFIYGCIFVFIYLCEDEVEFGYIFYMMEWVKGIILCN